MWGKIGLNALKPFVSGSIDDIASVSLVGRASSSPGRPGARMASTHPKWTRDRLIFVGRTGLRPGCDLHDLERPHALDFLPPSPSY